MSFEEIRRAQQERLRGLRASRRREAERLALGLGAAGVLKVILFGSVAVGEDSFHSDIDLVAVTDAVAGQPFPGRLAPLLAKLQPRQTVDLLVYTAGEWTELCATRAFVREEIAGKGVLLYERPG